MFMVLPQTRTYCPPSRACVVEAVPETSRRPTTPSWVVAYGQPVLDSRQGPRSVDRAGEHIVGLGVETPHPTTCIAGPLVQAVVKEILLHADGRFDNLDWRDPVEALTAGSRL